MKLTQVEKGVLSGFLGSMIFSAPIVWYISPTIWSFLEWQLGFAYVSILGIGITIAELKKSGLIKENN